MPFPFIAPLKDWVVNKLKNREANPQASRFLSPFAMMTSGAVVLKDVTDVKDLFVTQQYGSNAYYGCVVTNTTDASKLYQTGKTIVGYDLNGKEITVDGEQNRRVSPPIIQSIEIDTDGGNNTLKTAHVKVKIFTLKQLEMFEVFYLRPSMNVVLEYGWNTDIRSSGVFASKINNTTIQKHLFAKKNWDAYKRDYVDFFTDRKKTSDYLTILKETEGNYDFMIGRVTGFSYQPAEDGTFDVDVEISSGNELQLWPAYKSAKGSSNVNKQNKIKVENYKSFIAKVAADLNLSILNDIFKDEKVWKQEFFNYGITNEKQKNTVVSKTPYISFKAIIEIINNLKTIKKPDEGIFVTYKFNNKDLIPVTSNPYIISTNPYILIPGELPKVVPQKIEESNRIVVSTKEKEKCLINGKSFNLNNTELYDFEKGEPKTVSDITITSTVTGKTYSKPPNTGNLLNIFVSYDRFLEILDVADSLTNILTPLLQAVNDTMLGLCSLEIQTINEVGVGKLEIIDRKTQNSTVSVTVPPYKFRIGPTITDKDNKVSSSIVRSLTFNMEMSTLMQAQALYSTQLAMAKQNKKVSTDASKEIDNYVSADLSYAKNADGYFSINDMEVSIIKKMPVPKEENTKTEKEQLEELKENITSKYTKFLIGNETKNMVYQDSGLIQLYLLPKTTPNSLALTYLDITLAIDGMSGFSCGEYFQIEGIPEIYNKNGYFQILNVKQGIDENGWKTTIDAGFLLKTEEPKK